MTPRIATTIAAQFLAASVGLLALACSSAPEKQAEPAPGAAAAAPASAPHQQPQPQQQPPEERELVVFAASSLRDAFSTLGADFERAHPGAHVTFNFAGTQELRTQLEQGAAADVLASADLTHMAALAQAGRVQTSATFARNEPVIVTTVELATTVRSLADLPKAKRLVIGADTVPIGRYTLQILERARPTLGDDFATRVQARVVSRELNVRQVLAKVKLGEADAAIVYRSDARTAPELNVVTIAPEVNVIAEYPIAIVTNPPHPTLANAWLELVRSAAGQRALADAGFLPAGAGS